MGLPALCIGYVAALVTLALVSHAQLTAALEVLATVLKARR
ncbi:hypothetical protein AB0N62_37220 [Streptomyces sp. NPDC093982]